MKYKKINVCKSYESTAASYDNRYREIQYEKYRELLDKIKFKEGWLILDVGGGTGLLKDFMTLLGRNIVLLDLSFSMLSQAKKKDIHTLAVCGDGENIPFRDKAFDAITCISTLQNMPDPLRSLKEQKRVAKPRAIIAISVLKKLYTKTHLIELIENVGLSISKIFEMRIEDIAAIAVNKKKKEIEKSFRS